MLILVRSEPGTDVTSAHLLSRELGPLCGTTLRRPDLWEIALVRVSWTWICTRCWRRRFAGDRLW